MIARGWAALLLAVLVGCGPTTRTVRLDTGRGSTTEHVPPQAVKPVGVDGEAFAEAIQTLGREVSASPNPREAAHRLFAESFPPRAYAWVRGNLGLVSVGPLPQRGRLLVPEVPEEGAELARDYGRWCARQARPGDCLRLLEDGPGLDEEARRTLAFHIALDAVWEETGEALHAMVDREAVVALLATTGAVYFGLWLLPEPVSKGVAAVLTVGLIAYLGWDTVWSLIQGFRVLAEQVRAATSFGEVRGAGERYGAVMGKNAARVFVLLATAALGSTAQTLAAKLPTLPGSAQAAVVGAEQGGFRLGAVGQVSAVAVSAEGVATIALDPEALAEPMHGTSAAASEPVSADIHEHHIATNKWWESTTRGGPWSTRFQKLFDQAGMSLDDAANKVRVKGHKGPHPREYHEEVHDRLRDATRDCDSMHECRQALISILEKLAIEINTRGTRLNKLVTRAE